MNKYLLIVGFLALLLLVFIWQIEASDLQNWVIDTYNLDETQAQKLKISLLNSRNWFWIKIFTSFFLFIVCALFFYFQKKCKNLIKNLLNDFQTLLKNCLIAFQSLSRSQWIIVVIILGILNTYILYQLHHKIPHIDEAFSYVHFASKGFFVSALYYPNPNNHIFFNLISSFFDVFIPNKIWVMRLPSFLSFLFLQILIFRFFLLKSSFSVALLAVLFFALLSPVQAYAIMGRGYILQMLFLWLSVHFLVKTLQNNFQKIDKFLFVFFSWAAFYTIPTFLYYFLALVMASLVLVLPNFTKIYVLCKLYFLTFLLVTITYLPILLLNGKENMFSESWQAFAKQEFAERKYDYFTNFGDFWIGIENTYFIFWGVFLAFLFIFLSQKKKDTKAILLVSMPFWVFLIMFLQQTIIPERVWIGLAISWAVVVGFSNNFLKKYAKFCLILLIFAEISALFYQKRHLDKGEYRNFMQIYPSIPFSKGEKVFSNDLVYQNLSAFYNLQEQKGLEIDYSDKRKTYQWLILEKNTFKNLPEGYVVWQETPFVLILRKNNLEHIKN